MVDEPLSMSLLQKIMSALLGFVVLTIAVGFLLPSGVHVERDLLIDAEPEDVFPLISDLHAWNEWSPWATMDPDAAIQITGSGQGQTMMWSSANPQVGQGTQEIVSLEAPHLLKTHLEFGQQGIADATFNLISQGEQTQVVWSLDTDMRAGVPLWQQPISTYFRFLMDAMIGKNYETGLQNLKALVER